ncbi:MAG: helix-hairpin-helix domain-containing protein [Ginsengibacter sp.]
MTNKKIAQQFSLLSKLMDIHGENSFSAKNYSIAAYRIEKLPMDLNNLDTKEIFSLPSIGESTGKKILEIIAGGELPALRKIIDNTPEGILEMMKIKGIGPKKIHLIWKKMGIENIGELLYACNENRLSNFKGFGKKTQDNVIESIGFYLSQQGNYLFAQVEQLSIDLLKQFQQLFGKNNIQLTGEIRRHSETINILEYLIPVDLTEISKTLQSHSEFEYIEQSTDFIVYQYNNGIKLKLYACPDNKLIELLFITTGSDQFIDAFKQSFPAINYWSLKDEQDIFKEANIQYIPPFLREDAAIISITKNNKIPQLIQPIDIKAIIHCHSNWSDGTNTLEQLAEACIKSGKEYLVISDHSKAADYAQGLSEERITAQHKLVDELNEKLKPFKIFKSIESDILNDGNLDYSNSILSTFDLVIASVHSNLKMNEEKAMMRVLKAIENPYTTILGHMTGRLLLSRPGYPLDHKKIIDACASNNVVIEINANPHRLDMRWQWIEYAKSKNILFSIDPDSHSIPEFENTRYGVLIAQKGMVTAKENLSSFSLAEFENFLKSRNKAI